MQILVVKLSSMGDIIHTLPALTDAAAAISQVKFDWLIEPGFAEIPRWHPAVQNIITVPLRAWKKQLLTTTLQKDIKNLFSSLRSKQYDVILDAQGLLKSAALSRLGKSKIYGGFSADSAREKMASVLYNTTISVPKNLHAIERTRKLFAGVLQYDINAELINYGVPWKDFVGLKSVKPYLFFLHGTTWETKHWPEAYWLELANIAGSYGYLIYMTWATAEQKSRVERLSAQCKFIVMLPHLTITEALLYLKESSGIVAVDTGFAHLGSALDVPVVSLFGPTDPKLVGMLGKCQINLNSPHIGCSPCLKRVCAYTETSSAKPACLAALTPPLVWKNLLELMSFNSRRSG